MPTKPVPGQAIRTPRDQRRAEDRAAAARRWAAMDELIADALGEAPPEDHPAR